MELGAMKDGFENVLKKRKLCFSKTQEVIDQIGHKTEKALAQTKRYHPVPANMKAILTNLRSALYEIDPLDKLEGPQKDLNSALTNCSRLLAKFFNPDISKAHRDVDLDFHILNQIIVTHFYREGLFEIGDKMRFEAREAKFAELKSRFKEMHQLLLEAREAEFAELKCRFKEMHRLLDAMKDKKLRPAINWAHTNREILRQHNSNLEFKLHRQHLLKMLETGKLEDAFDYAKNSIMACVSPHDPFFQELMCCIPWGRKIETSPYKGLLVHWETLPDELTREFCLTLDQPLKNPLRVVISAGIQGLPTLLKLANVMAGNKKEWLAMKQLIVPVELGKEFQFHPIFVCPVSREESSKENQAMLLPCFHALCRQSIIYLTRRNTFKCPHCSSVARLDQCRELHFGRLAY